MTKIDNVIKMVCMTHYMKLSKIIPRTTLYETAMTSGLVQRYL